MTLTHLIQPHKASSDHFVRAYGETYGMPMYITTVLIIMEQISFQKN